MLQEVFMCFIFMTFLQTDPGSQTSATETQQRIIQQYIQQAVTEAMAANKNDRPVGLNREQVEAVVEGLLTREIKLLKAEVEGRMDFLKVFCLFYSNSSIVNVCFISASIIMRHFLIAFVTSANHLSSELFSELGSMIHRSIEKNHRRSMAQ